MIDTLTRDEVEEWLALDAPCSLCGKPTGIEPGAAAEWYLCPACEGTPEAEAAGSRTTTTEGAAGGRTL